MTSPAVPAPSWTHSLPQLKSQTTLTLVAAQQIQPLPLGLIFIGTSPSTKQLRGSEEKEILYLVSETTDDPNDYSWEHPWGPLLAVPAYLPPHLEPFECFHFFRLYAYITIFHPPNISLKMLLLSCTFVCVRQRDTLFVLYKKLKQGKKCPQKALTHSRPASSWGQIFMSSIPILPLLTKRKNLKRKYI